MRLFFDFDSTLYATSRLWDHWCGLLQEHFETNEKFQEAADALRPVGFTLEGHARGLGLDETAVARVCGESRTFMKRHGPSLVFPDVADFLNNHADCRHAILTYGEEGYQREKISTAGLGGHFDEIHVCAGDRAKARRLKDLLADGETAVLVDDHPQALLDVHETGLPVRLVRIIREGERFAVPHGQDSILWPTIKSLDELDGLFG